MELPRQSKLNVFKTWPRKKKCVWHSSIVIQFYTLLCFFQNLHNLLSNADMELECKSKSFGGFDVWNINITKTNKQVLCAHKEGQFVTCEIPGNAYRSHFFVSIHECDTRIAHNAMNKHKCSNIVRLSLDPALANTNFQPPIM